MKRTLFYPIHAKEFNKKYWMLSVSLFINLIIVITDIRGFRLNGLYL